ncbi:hypothetical protein FVE85_5222 [Porphyridium purpureum]|uniref:Uncharacterized protein n=1 Tax=Porphyridium purpureum TaxID=35688 RepID=A0A5J4Z4W7_PORPP|nr:hypothetical protein FVE85_5222 [Porphyridium purpureum]|eukprot:POR8787..scf295_1
MVSHTVPSGTNRLINRHFEAVPSELRLQASPATANKVKWTLAAAVVCTLVVTFTFMAGMGPKKHTVNVYGRALPNNGMMRADTEYECDADWYCHTAGANCDANNMVIGELDEVITERCEFRKMAHDLTSVATFLALAPEVKPSTWPCKRAVMDNCNDDMPYGCPYLELCGDSEKDDISDVITAASEFVPQQAESLTEYQDVWSAFSTENCPLAGSCTAEYDSNLCTKKGKMRLARRLIGKAMARVSMDIPTSHKVGDIINCLTCPVTVGKRDYVCMEKQMQEYLGGLLGIVFDSKVLLPKKRKFNDMEDAISKYNPAMSELAICHPLCKALLKGNIGIFTYAYESCCAAASYN